MAGARRRRRSSGRYHPTADADNGRGAGTRATLAELLERWWEPTAGSLSSTTAREYQRLIDKRLRPVIDEREQQDQEAAA